MPGFPIEIHSQQSAVCARRVIQRTGTHKHGKSDGMWP